DGEGDVNYILEQFYNSATITEEGEFGDVESMSEALLLLCKLNRFCDAERLLEIQERKDSCMAFDDRHISAAATHMHQTLTHEKLDSVGPHLKNPLNRFSLRL